MASNTPTPVTRPIVYGLAAIADCDAEDARLALTKGLAAVSDKETRAALRVAARTLSVNFPGGSK